VPDATAVRLLLRELRSTPTTVQLIYGGIAVFNRSVYDIRSCAISQIREDGMLIGNLPLDTSDKELVEFFGTVGKVGRVEILKDKAGRGRGFAFVTMTDHRAKQQAVSALHNTEFKGRVISVSPANGIPQPKPRGFLFNLFRTV